MLGSGATVNDGTESPGSPTSADIDDAVLLDDLAEFVSRFVVFPLHAQPVAVALWVAHTHAIKAFETTPRLAVLSAEKQSGKSRLLEVLALLCPRAIHTSNISTAALFRTIEAVGPTLLIDETDAIFGSRRRDQEDQRALLNAGHRRGVHVHRCEGTFDVFCPVALAGLRDLPETLHDRSILIRMKRRRPDEPVESFRPRQVEPEATVLYERLAACADQNIDQLRDAEPAMPTGLTDRAADVWEPLVAIADLAGGEWPARARAAAIELNAARRNEESSLGTRLLEDIRTVFEDSGKEQVSTKQILEGLHRDETAPWATGRGKPLDDRSLAKQLQPYGIAPRSMKFGVRTRRGYARWQFTDAWSRYLRPPAG